MNDKTKQQKLISITFENVIINLSLRAVLSIGIVTPFLSQKAHAQNLIFRMLGSIKSFHSSRFSAYRVLNLLDAGWLLIPFVVTVGNWNKKHS